MYRWRSNGGDSGYRPVRRKDHSQASSACCLHGSCGMGQGMIERMRLATSSIDSRWSKKLLHGALAEAASEPKCNERKIVKAYRASWRSQAYRPDIANLFDEMKTGKHLSQLCRTTADGHWNEPVVWRDHRTGQSPAGFSPFYPSDESPPSDSSSSAGTKIMPAQVSWPWSVIMPMEAPITRSPTPMWSA